MIDQQPAGPSSSLLRMIYGREATITTKKSSIHGIPADAADGFLRIIVDQHHREVVSIPLSEIESITFRGAVLRPGRPPWTQAENSREA